MAHYDNPRRQHRDSQQEGFSSQARQQGSPDPAHRPQGGYGREDQRGDHGGSDWHREQRPGREYRGEEWQSGGAKGNAFRINEPAGSGGGYYGAQERERAPYESNYGYESSHPSYQARGAGDWSGRPDSGIQNHEQEQFDPDYHQWRREQMQALDEDYRQFRQDRYRKFSDEFSSWRSSRSQQGGQPSDSAGSSDGNKQGRDKEK
ncbi:hypothetical protein [Hydrogenophaga sp.]|uniref:hypothetical protein n=1 Tax=Hydrogenophaga sp. TaxID=1904254 RepID=UPI002FCA6635